MSLCMYASMYVRHLVCKTLCLYSSFCVYLFVCLPLCMYTSLYICLFVCLYVCLCYVCINVPSLYDSCIYASCISLFECHILCLYWCSCLGMHDKLYALICFHICFYVCMCESGYCSIACRYNFLSLLTMCYCFSPISVLSL